MITNGTIEFSRRIRTGDFEHKDAKVSLSFTVAAGINARETAEYVGNLAVERALAMVGEKPSTEQLHVQTLAAGIEAPPLVKDGGEKPYHGMIPPKETQPWPGPTVGEKVIDIVGNGVAVNPTEAVIPTASSLTTTSPSEPIVLTDKQLVEEVTAKQARLLSAAADGEREAVATYVPALIREFVPPPSKVHAIPQERRQEFLDRLAAL